MNVEGATGGSRRALFLDRDGVINVDHGYVCSPEQTQFLDGIFDLCRAASDAGYLLVIVTNQAGIGRGLYSEQAYRSYMEWMQAQFASCGVRFAGIYHCPHHPTAAKGEYLKNCDCRKPAPGLIRKAAEELRLDLQNSILIGDKISDMQAAIAAGVGTRLLLQRAEPASGRGAEWTAVDSLTDAIDEIRFRRIARSGNE